MALSEGSAVTGTQAPADASASLSAATVASVPRESRPMMVSPWLVLIAGIGISIASFAYVRTMIEDVASLRFDRQARDAAGVIEDRILFYADILYALRALFASQGVVTRSQFQRFVHALKLKDRFPGFDVVNYAVHVRREDRARFVESVRRDTSLTPEGYPRFDIKPPGERDEYFVLAYVEPMQGFEFAFGRDLGANVDSASPQQIAAAQRQARDTGTLTASGVPISIRARGREYMGLALRLAVYQAGLPTDTVDARRAAYLGSVGAGFGVEEMMKGVLTGEAAQYMRFSVFDVGAASELAGSSGDVKRLHLFDGGASARTRSQGVSDSEGAVFERVLPLAFAGRSWEVTFRAPKSAVIGLVDSALPWVVLGTGMLSSALLWGVLYSLASSRRRAVKIADEITKDLRASERELRASTEQIQAMSRRLVELQESERREFSRELHDRVGQNLTALSISLDILCTELAQKANQAELARLNDAAKLVEATHLTIQNVMTELRPPMLDDYGLLSAIQWYAADFTRRTGIEVSVRGDERMQRLSQAVEIGLFRIVQEAFTNIAKHAHATRIHISLQRSQRVVVMSILDNGVGLDAAVISAPEFRQGLGVVNMRERAQAFGGEFELETGPAGGTEVIVRVPC
jgi:signal transduction histidine kinase